VDCYRFRLIIRRSINASFALCVQQATQENGQATKDKNSYKAIKDQNSEYNARVN